MTTASLSMRPALAGALCVGLASAVFAPRALAQAPVPPPPQQSAPRVLPAPARAVAPAQPPMTRAPAAQPTAAQPAVAPAVRPAAPGLAPDSMRPAPAATVSAIPAGALARCADGSYIVAPADAGGCAAHGGVRVTFRQRSAPPPPAARPVPTARVARAAAADAAPPAGATMRCKDGTWLTGAPAEGRCAANGGTATVLPAPRPTPQAPLPRRP